MMKQQIIQLISENQNKLYSYCHNSLKQNFAGVDFEVVNATPFAWPVFIFKLSSESCRDSAFCKFLAGKIVHKAFPPFLKILSPLGDKKPIDTLIAEGIKPVAREKGMALNKADYRTSPNELYQDTEVIEVQTEVDIENWLNLASENLFNGKSLDKKHFESLVNSENAKLYLSFYKHELAGTALTFTQDNTTGIYFVSTQKSFRHKGIGSKITRFALNEAFGAGSDRVILHATKQSFYLYKSLGFKEYCNFDIYWKLGY